MWSREYQVSHLSVHFNWSSARSRDQSQTSNFSRARPCHRILEYGQESIGGLSLSNMIKMCHCAMGSTCTLACLRNERNSCSVKSAKSFNCNLTCWANVGTLSSTFSLQCSFKPQAFSVGLNYWLIVQTDIGGSDCTNIKSRLTFDADISGLGCRMILQFRTVGLHSRQTLGT